MQLFTEQFERQIVAADVQIAGQYDQVFAVALRRRRLGGQVDELAQLVRLADAMNTVLEFINKTKQKYNQISKLLLRSVS